MPRWNFGTETAIPEAQAHQAKKAGTLRSHAINMTFRDDGTVRHHTIPRHPSLAMMAQLAQAGLVRRRAHLLVSPLSLTVVLHSYYESSMLELAAQQSLNAALSSLQTQDSCVSSSEISAWLCMALCPCLTLLKLLQWS